jgi:hypothetical protein
MWQSSRGKHQESEQQLEWEASTYISAFELHRRRERERRRQRTNLTPIFSLSGFQLFPVRSTFDSLPIMFNLAALCPAGDAGNTTKAEIDEAP